MDTINQPHGGTLTTLFVDDEKAAAYKTDPDLPSWDLHPQQLNDVELLILGAYSPLVGMLCRKDYISVVADQTLADGTFWPLPLALAVDSERKTGTKLGLRDAEGVLIAVMTVKDCWQNDSGEWLLGGPLEGTEPPLYYDFSELRFPPQKIREYLSKQTKSESVVLFAKEPIHKAEIASINASLTEIDASLTLITLAGGSELRNLDHFSNVRCHRAILGEFQTNSVTHLVFPAPPQLCDDREAALQAIIAQNCGFSHLFSKCKISCKSLRTNQLNLNYTKFAWKRALENGQPFPEDFTFPEVETELRKTHPPRHEKGLTLFFSGFSGSGKSTIAQHVQVKLQEQGNRSVTLLDGDLVRKNLSSELGFSRDHRNLNILRIGFVANEITKNRGVAICAPIAPYDEIRKQVRSMIESNGNFVLIHVATPLEVCESRDRKGLYAKARAGLIKEFTGISDPYDFPEDAELSIQTTDCTPAEASERVLEFLEAEGYLLS